MCWDPQTSSSLARIVPTALFTQPPNLLTTRRKAAFSIGWTSVRLTVSPVSAMAPFKYERIDKAEAALLIVDHQEGLYMLAHDYSPVQFKNNLLAHAALAKIFDLPVVLTSSSETGVSAIRPSHGSRVGCD